MIWSHVRHVVPSASCAFFLRDVEWGAVTVKFAAGEASSALQGLQIPLGERLTGWVAEHRQPIVNSDASLDLGPEAAFVGVKHCVSLPLLNDGHLAGVLSLYAAESFRDEQVQTLVSVLPHLALMFLSLEKRDAGVAVPVAARPPLRMVASR
jgi:GAF domain-containing protein